MVFEVRVDDPFEQGLRQSVKILIKPSQQRVRVDDPFEQGLRLNKLIFLPSTIFCQSR